MTFALKRAQQTSAAATTSLPDVQEKVAEIIADIRARGDEAVREHSARFDKWEPESFRLSQAQIDEIMARVPEQVIADIRFVQQQVRGFAEKQLESMREIEVETLPGVHLGQKHIPVAAAGAYVPGAGSGSGSGA